MGCGASKAAPANNVAPADPPAQPATAPAPAATVPAPTPVATPAAPVVPAQNIAPVAPVAPAPAAPKKIQVDATKRSLPRKSSYHDSISPEPDAQLNEKRDAHSASSQNSYDSGFTDELDDGRKIITERTEGGERIASVDRPATPEFELSGQNYRDSQDDLRAQTTKRKERDSYSAVSTASTITTRSAPIIMERPKSRGGCAFDMTYDDEPKVKRIPARLKALEHRDKSKSGIGREATLAELEAKLYAAERRRSDYERRVKSKMAEESAKVELGTKSLTRQKTTLDASIVKSESKATENREKHLKNLRDKLKQKEKRAKQVRENKERIQREATKDSLKAGITA